MDPSRHAANGEEPARPATAVAHEDHRSTATPAQTPGLAMTDAGLRLEAKPTIVVAGEDVPFSFRILGPTGHPVTPFDELHERRMHLIVVRRDLTGFQHLHPAMDEGGTWRTSFAAPTGGAWRAFADFATGGTPTTLGIDVLVEGEFRPEALPRPAPSVEAGGDLVSLHVGDGGLHGFSVTRGGERVPVEPYLGARGHLVVLRWGDLAFLHVHPIADGADDIAFAVTYPSSGVYRLFLQYSAGGEVRTAALTTAAG